MRKLAENLRLEYTQFLELEIFTRFGGMVDDRTRHIIEHGRRIRAVLTQPQCSGLAMPHQVALLLALNEGMLDSLPLDKVTEFRDSLAQWLGEKDSAQIERIKSTGELDDETRAALRTLMAELVATCWRLRRRCVSSRPRHSSPRWRELRKSPPKSARSSSCSR